MDIDKTINDRFNEVKNHFGLSVNKFAKMIGLSQPSTKAIIDGDNEPSNKAIDGLAKGFPMISMDWLIRGVGSMCCSTASDAEIFGTSSSVPANGLTTEAQRTHSGGTTEDVRDERIKLLEDRIAFLEEQVDFYKNRK